MQIITKNKNGSYVIEMGAIEDIAAIAALKDENVLSAKKDRPATVKLKDEALYVSISIKLVQGSNVAKTCQDVQQRIDDALKENLNLKAASIDVTVHGFESKDA